MQSAISEKIKSLPIFDEKDIFLFVELISDFIRISLVKTLGETSIEVLKSRFIVNSLADYSIAIENLKAAVREFPSHCNVIISLDYQLATTTQSGSSVIRSHPTTSITEVDLDNLISKALWKIFSKQRKRAAKKMEVSDVEVSLFSANIIQVKLDGNRVMNPIDFEARTVEIWAQQDIVLKAILKDLTDIFPEENILSIEEASGVVAGIVSSIKEDEKVIFADVAADKTVIYEIDNFTLKYLDVISWGTNLVNKIICETFGVDKEVANKILDLYSNKEVSRSVIQKINEIISGEFAILLKGIDSYCQESKITNSYIHAFYKLPKFLFSKQFKNKLKIITQVVNVNAELIGKNFNFDLKLSRGCVNENLPSLTHLLASYIRSNTQRGSELLKKIARRRARWLRSQ